MSVRNMVLMYIVMLERSWVSREIFNTATKALDTGAVAGVKLEAEDRVELESAVRPWIGCPSEGSTLYR